MIPAIPAARPLIGESEVAAVIEVLESWLLAQGQQVADFEHEFSDTVGSRECKSVNSGTLAPNQVPEKFVQRNGVCDQALRLSCVTQSATA